jgi:hypothetical protein
VFPDRNLQPIRESRLVKLRDSHFLYTQESNSWKDHSCGSGPVSPRITSCLLIAIGFGAGAAVWTLAAGWGFLAALAVYSFVGSTALVAFAVMASLVPTRNRRAVVIARPPALSRPATAHTG